MAIVLSRRITILSKCIYTSLPFAHSSSQNRVFITKPLHHFHTSCLNKHLSVEVEICKNGVITRRFMCKSAIDTNPNSSFDPKNSAAKKFILYSYWQSSCSWRVRFALNLKGLSYEYRAVNLSKGEQFAPEFEKLNPLKYVPVLVDGDVVVSDSYSILLYLEEKYPEKPLLPVDPQLRAINLQAASIVSSSIQPLIMLSVLKYIEDKVGRQAQLSFAQSILDKGFLALERLLRDISGRYATGDEVYLADVFLAPQIYIGKARFNMDISKYPVLSKIHKSCEALPAFQASLPERQPDAQSR
ncbi:isomerase [Lithospermum erythrorhizon]|uniref:glutathione transferase n=1 Tax=Lithospermum erythrorhizon TaxID=34254 RepID=A0AAV3P169_LITER